MKQSYVVQSVPGYSYTEILLDEVALEGLGGISLKGLWMRMSARMSCEITETQKMYLWKLLINISHIKFYELPNPAPLVVIFNRFSFVDDFSGVIYEPETSLNHGYIYSPVDGQNGSCDTFFSRIEISKTVIAGLTYKEALSKWEQRLVMVASVEARWAALAPQMPMNVIQYLQPFHYCLLELIGKARYNGQTTVGRHSLSVITKDAKLLFYQRKLLLELGLVNKSSFCQCASFGAPAQHNLLLRLPRFQQERISTLPTSGVLHNLITYLKRAPGNEESMDVIRKHLGITNKRFKMILKRVDMRKKITMKIVKKTLNESEDKDEEPPKKKVKKCIKERRLVLIDDEEASSEESDEEIDKSKAQEYKCRFRIGVPIARQAYQAIIKSGDKGMTQVELGKYLGMDTFTVRTVCRHLKATKVVYEYLADKGRQRMSRYIGMKSINNAESTIKYQNEHQKLLDYMTTNIKSVIESATKNQASTSKSNISEEFSNLQEEVIGSSHFFNEPDTVSEVHHLRGVAQNSFMLTPLASGITAHPSFRQLRNTNAIIEAVREKKVMVGLQSLKELESIPFKDSKPLKRALQRLAAIGQIKLLNIRTPKGPNEATVLLICDPQIKKNDMLVRMAYNEMCLRSYRNKRENRQNISQGMSVGSNEFLMGKYLRAQLLHKFLFSLVYESFNRPSGEHESLKPGWIYFMDMMPRISVGLAVGHIIITTGEAHIMKQLSELDLNTPLNAAPVEIKEVLLGLTRLSTSIRTTLTLLAAMGLVQFGQYCTETMYSLRDLRTFKFFINRNATVVNTADKKDVGNFQENNFYFKTSKDVEEYWELLENVCTYTKVGKKVKKIPSFMPPMREHPQELEHDVGRTPGDGAGPGGLDSSFNVTLPRLWARRKCDDPFPKLKGSGIEPVLRPTIPRKKRCLSRADISSLYRKKIVNTQKIKTKTIKSTQMLTKVKPTLRSAIRTRLRRNSVPWSAREDRILLLLRVAKNFICNGSVAYGGTLCAKLIREIFKVTCGSTNKTVKNIIIRTKQLEKNKSVVIEQERQLAEARRRPALVDRFQNLYFKLKVQFLNNVPKFLQQFRISLIELALALSWLPMQSHCSELVPAVASSLPELHQCFKLINVHSTHNKSINDVEASLKFEDISLTTVTELIHAALNVPASKRITSAIFKIFKDFPEHLLRCATTQLHTKGIISFYKNTQNISNMTSSEKISKSCYYRISAAYNRRMRDRLFSYLPAEVTKWFKDAKPCEEAASHSASVCSLLELSTCDKVELSICVPEELVFENTMQYSVDNLCLATCAVGWKISGAEASLEPSISSKKVLTYIEGMRQKLIQVSELPKEMKIPKTIQECLEDKKELGATFADLEKVLSEVDVTKTDLKILLKDLETKRYIFRVGHDMQRWVLPQYSIPWLGRVDELFINPRPWLCLDGKINFDIFAGWSSAVVFQCAETPGCTIEQLAENFEFVQIIHIFELCRFLMDMDVVKLVLITAPQAGLFENDNTDFSFDSNYLALKEANEFDPPSSVSVLLQTDAVIKLSKILSILQPKFFNNL